MPILTGPCAECGEPLTRRMRPGRPLRHGDCAAIAAARAQWEQHLGTHPSLEATRASGEATRAQLAAREGPLYDRWVAGMIRAATGGSPTP